MTDGSLMKVESIAESIGALCNTFVLHQTLIGIENKFWVFIPPVRSI